MSGPLGPGVGESVGAAVGRGLSVEAGIDGETVSVGTGVGVEAAVLVGGWVVVGAGALTGAWVADRQAVANPNSARVAMVMRTFILPS